MRVVITGIGAVTPLGVNLQETWEAVLKGKSGIALCSRIDTSSLPYKLAGEVNTERLKGFFTEKQLKRLDPFVQYAVVSAVEAVKDARTELPPDTAIIIGTSRAGVTFIEQALGSSRFSSYLMPATTANMACSQVAEELNLKGESMAVSAACASGAMALMEAYRLIRSGYAKVALAGASDAPITRLCLEGYGKTGVLSKQDTPEASRPFDRRRDGFVLSEGACMMVLEELERAEKRGARIYAEVLSAECLTSRSGQTRPDKEDEIEVMRRALVRANTEPGEIKLVNAHATSTQLGDRVEAEAITELFGEGVYVTANKSQTGHMLGASSALEIALSALSIHQGVIPPTINTTEPELKINILSEPLEAPVGKVLKNSFGFGGVNVAVVLGCRV